MIITDSDHIILSAVQPETVGNRLIDKGGSEAQSNEGLEEDEEA